MIVVDFSFSKPIGVERHKPEAYVICGPNDDIEDSDEAQDKAW